MGLLDGMLGNALGSILGGGQSQGRENPLGSILSGLTGGDNSKGNDILGSVLGMVQQSGGLGGVLDMFKKSGLTEQADSWVGTGPNKEISGSQVQQVFGASALEGIASTLGLSGEQTGSAVAQVLPELVNQFTPDGKLPEGQGDMLSKALSLLKGGG